MFLTIKIIMSTLKNSAITDYIKLWKNPAKTLVDRLEYELSTIKKWGMWIIIS